MIISMPNKRPKHTAGVVDTAARYAYSVVMFVSPSVDGEAASTLTAPPLQPDSDSEGTVPRALAFGHTLRQDFSPPPSLFIVAALLQRSHQRLGDSPQVQAVASGARRRPRDAGVGCRELQPLLSGIERDLNGAGILFPRTGSRRHGRLLPSREERGDRVEARGSGRGVKVQLFRFLRLRIYFPIFGRAKMKNGEDKGDVRPVVFQFNSKDNYTMFS